MLNKGRILDSDRYVRFFYEQLLKTKPNIHGQDLSKGFSLDIFAANYCQNAKRKIAAIMRKAQAAAARECGVDSVGLEQLITRVPVIFYIPLQGEEKDKWNPFNCNRHSVLAHNINARFYLGDDQYETVDTSPLENRLFEIGLCPDSLETHAWNHSPQGLSDGSGMYKHTSRTGNLSIVSYVQRSLSEEIQLAFSGVAYFGVGSRKKKVIIFVDTSAGSKAIQGNARIAHNCLETASRYGLDGLFTLYATQELGRGPIDGEFRLDACDKDKVNLEQKELKSAYPAIQKKWEEDTFNRMLVQKNLVYDNPDWKSRIPEQDIRDLMRERIELTMQRRMYEQVDDEIRCKNRS